MKRADAGYALLCLSWLACGPGPTVYLGDAPRADAAVAPDAGEASEADAGEEDDDDGDGDDDDGDGDREPCVDTDECTEGKRTLCDLARNVCVECLSDRDCGDGERCRLDEGECDD